MGIAENWLWISPKDVRLYLYSEFQLHELCMILFLDLFSYLIFIYAYSSPTRTRMAGRSCLIFKPFFMHLSCLVPALHCSRNRRAVCNSHAPLNTTSVLSYSTTARLIQGGTFLPSTSRNKRNKDQKIFGFSCNLDFALI